MNIDLTALAEVFITLFVALALRYVLPWIKSKTTAQQRDDLLVWVDIAVCAAQQLFHQSSGSMRLEYAMNLLESKGFDIDDVAVRDAVEAAVLRLHQELERSA